MKYYLLLLAVITQLSFAQTPTYNVETRVLKLPKVEIIDGALSSFLEVEFIASPDLSSFAPVSTDVVKPAPEIETDDVSGTFSGNMAVYLPGALRVSSFQACPEFSFNPTTTTIVVGVNGNNIAMSHDAFEGNKCNYTGVIDGDNVTGVFQCNDFNQGTWKANVLKLPTALGDTFTSHISFAGEKCSFDASFTGIRK